MIEHGGNLDWAIKNFGGKKKRMDRFIDRN